MPYFIDPSDGRYCVRKGTKENPGEVVDCHDDEEKALSHLRALYANVEDAKEMPLTGFWTVKEAENRWLAISTVDEIDREGEAFGAEAIDYAIRHAERTKEYPELRVFHVRGLKAGKADRMTRIGRYAVDEGYYFDHPFAKETRRVIDAGGLPGVSRGFRVLEATGRCPKCDTRLRVQARGIKNGFQCPTCEGIFAGKSLRGLRFTKATVFDVTATDSPAVPSTAIANYVRQPGAMKEFTTMSREELKERLVKRGFAEEVVTAWLEGLSDDDLLRMKEEDDAVKEFRAAVEEASKEDPAPETPPDVEVKEGYVTCTKCGARMRVRLPEAQKEIVLDPAPIVQAVKDALPKEMELEIPGIDAKFKEMEAKLQEIKDLLNHLDKTEEDKLKEIVRDASPATLTRLRLRTKEYNRETPTTEPTVGKVKVKTGDGKEVDELSQAFGLTPAQ